MRIPGRQIHSDLAVSSNTNHVQVVVPKSSQLKQIQVYQLLCDPCNSPHLDLHLAISPSTRGGSGELESTAGPVTVKVTWGTLETSHKDSTIR